MNESESTKMFGRFLERLSFELELEDILIEKGLKKCSHILKIEGECINCKPTENKKETRH